MWKFHRSIFMLMQLRISEVLLVTYFARDLNRNLFHYISETLDHLFCYLSEILVPTGSQSFFIHKAILWRSKKIANNIKEPRKLNRILTMNFTINSSCHQCHQFLIIHQPTMLATIFFINGNREAKSNFVAILLHTFLIRKTKNKRFHIINKTLERFIQSFLIFIFVGLHLFCLFSFS